MAKTQSSGKPRQDDATSAKSTAAADDKTKKLILTGADIVAIGPEAEILVGGKNYNTALISQISGIRAPQFRAVSSQAFHRVLDETKVNAAMIREVVDDGYRGVNWNDEDVNCDPEFVKNLVRKMAEEARAKMADTTGTAIKLRTFINNVVEGFATSPEGIDQLRKTLRPGPGRHPVRRDAGRGPRGRVQRLQRHLPRCGARRRPRGRALLGRRRGQSQKGLCRPAGHLPQHRRRQPGGQGLSVGLRLGLQPAVHDLPREAHPRRRGPGRTDGRQLHRRTGQAGMGHRTDLAVRVHHAHDQSRHLRHGLRRRYGHRLPGHHEKRPGLHRRQFRPWARPWSAAWSPRTSFSSFSATTAAKWSSATWATRTRRSSTTTRKAAPRWSKVPEEQAYRWALSLAQAEEVARGVRAISVAYGGMIMDTEFCIDQSDRLWFVQARPETRWNEEFELHPHTIFMRRMEVDKTAIEGAEVILEGNGASRGAGQGMVRFLRSALELNKVQKGDILAAERTDPDMVPGMRIASAILADAGGDTSHAAITSRELGIPAVIGIQHAEILRSLDGQTVTVDGSRGRVYRGILPLLEVGGEMDLSKLPATKTKVGLILADVGQALFLSRLRNVPDFEVGLLRAEFMLGNIGRPSPGARGVRQQYAAPARRSQDQGTQWQARQDHARATGRRFHQHPDQTAQLCGPDYGPFRRVGYPGRPCRRSRHRRSHGHHRRIRELDKKLDAHLEEATRRLDLLKTSADLETHIAVILGYWDELQTRAADPDAVKRRYEIKARIEERAAAVAEEPIIKETLSRIAALRQEVARQVGIKNQIDDLSALTGQNPQAALLPGLPQRQGTLRPDTVPGPRALRHGLPRQGHPLPHHGFQVERVQKPPRRRSVRGSRRQPHARLPGRLPQHPRLGDRVLQAGPRASSAART